MLPDEALARPPSAPVRPMGSCVHERSLCRSELADGTVGLALHTSKVIGVRATGDRDLASASQGFVEGIAIIGGRARHVPS